MALIKQNYLDDLYRAADSDLVGFIGKFVPLKKSGKNYTACCPFHEEKSPSFSVNVSKGFYRCYGCNESGSGDNGYSAALSFLMAYKQLQFRDAIYELARHIGFRPPELEPTDAVPNAINHAKTALKDASGFFLQCLKQQPEVITYIKGRGVVANDIRQFGIGFAPKGNELIRELKSKHTFTVMEDAGLILRNEDNKQQLYDFFRNRVMFPIHDFRGQIVGFGGRALGDIKPKYINTADTPLFNKSELLYGWWQMAQASSPEKGVINVVEGYMDVVAMHRHGLNNTVAGMGTSLSAQQIQQIARRANHIRFLFDGDKAGYTAAVRAVSNIIPHLSPELRATVVILPTGADPDSLLASEGKPAMIEAYKGGSNAHTFIVHDLLRGLDRADPYALAGAHEKAKALFSSCQNDSLRKVMLQYLERTLSMVPQLQPLEAPIPTPTSNRSADIDPEWMAVIDKCSSSYLEFVKCVLAEPNWLKLQPNNVTPNCPLNIAEGNLSDLLESSISAAKETGRPVKEAFDSPVINKVIAYLIDSAPTATKDQIDAIEKKAIWARETLKKNIKPRLVSCNH